MGLGDQLRTGEGSTSDGMAEGFWLGLGGWRSRESRLGFSGGRSVGEKLDFLADGAAKVVK